MTVRNFAEALRSQADRLGPRPALLWTRFGAPHNLSWQRYYADAHACAAALVDVGVQVGDRVGLLAENRVEWLLADMGILLAGAVNVPPHAPLSAKQIAQQFADAGVVWLFVSSAEQLDKVRSVLAELPSLRGIVIFDPPRQVVDSPVPVRAWLEFLSVGRRKPASRELAERELYVQPDFLATIMYTSGTTGRPKGVLLTHGNLLANALAIDQLAPAEAHHLQLNWLPLSHIYARTIDHYRALVSGTSLALAESQNTVARDLRDFRPTHFAGVPRFYEKVLAACSHSDANATARRLRCFFGPRIEWLMSGGASLPLPLAQAYQRAGLLILQGYGLTETSPVVTFNRPDCFRIESVGKPLPGVDLRIADDGEILTRGPHVTRGYWNNPQATADALRDGWLHTGDLGQLDSDGFLHITGRKKDLLVLSNGKKVVPTLVESLLAADECIDQAVVHGEGRSFLTALIVPHWDNLRRALAAEGTPLADDSPERLAVSPAVVGLLQQRIAKTLADLASWEQVKKFVILPRPFSLENDELTVSLKLRRGVVLERHARLLDALYAANDGT